MIARLCRALRRWHHRQHIKDRNAEIAFYEAQQRGLPGAIRNAKEMRRFHEGRVATLSETRSPVNYHLGIAQGVGQKRSVPE